MPALEVRFNKLTEDMRYPVLTREVAFEERYERHIKAANSRYSMMQNEFALVYGRQVSSG